MQFYLPVLNEYTKKRSVQHFLTTEDEKPAPSDEQSDNRRVKDN